MRVSLPSENGKFNEEVIVDVFVIKWQSVLSILDRDNKFLACVQLKTVTAAAIWDGLLRAWSLKYLGHPQVLRTDQGTNFTVIYLQQWAGEAGTSVHSVAVEASWAMGTGGRVHGPLWQTFLKLLEDHPTTDFDLLLDLAVKLTTTPQAWTALFPHSCVLEHSDVFSFVIKYLTRLRTRNVQKCNRQL